MLWKDIFHPWDPNQPRKRKKTSRFVMLFFVYSFWSGMQDSHSCKNNRNHVLFREEHLIIAISRVFSFYTLVKKNIRQIFCSSKRFLLQLHLEQLELEGSVKVNYTGSWLKTVNWLQWLTLLAVRSYNACKLLLKCRTLTAQDSCYYFELTFRKKSRKRVLTEEKKSQWLNY